MTDEKKPDNLEMEKIKLERFKVWGRIITVAITVLFGSVLVALINYSIQDRQLKQQKLINENELELQKKKAEAERRQAEMKYLGDFITFALEDDKDKRLRFADYFATLTLSTELKTNWESYRDSIIHKQEEFEETQELLAKARKGKDIKRVEALETMVVQQQAQLESLPKRLERYLDKKEAGLNKRWRPRKYTDNEYELENDGKVVFDRNTRLMWQQSGSDEEMTYFEVKSYVEQLNRYIFAGYSDWRLPTMEEALSLLESEMIGANNMYINPKFNEKQNKIWTSDLYSELNVWVVYLDSGGSHYLGVYDNVYVRAVR
jgi:hypothetical protein